MFSEMFKVGTKDKKSMLSESIRDKNQCIIPSRKGA